MTLRPAHRRLPFFLFFRPSFLPTNVPGSFLPNRYHLPFFIPRPPREPSGLHYPHGVLHLPMFPPI